MITLAIRALCYSALVFCAQDSSDVQHSLSNERAELPENYCGGQALQLIAALEGRWLDSDRLHSVLPPDGEPISMMDLKLAAEVFGFHCAAVRWEPNQDPVFPSPAIIRMPVGPRDSFHYVVVSGRVGMNVQVLDFPHGPQLLTLTTLRPRWDGIALYVSADPKELESIQPRVRWYAIGVTTLAGCILGLIGEVAFRRFASRNSSASEPVTAAQGTTTGTE